MYRTSWLPLADDSSFTKPFSEKYATKSTVLVLRMAHRKWEKTKQQPGTAGPGNMLGCCLISFHFLWVILSTSTVERGDQNVSPTPHTHSFSAGFRHIKEEFEEIFSEDDLKAMNHDELAFAWFS